MPRSEVPYGQIIGIVGCDGPGKSTLLKILSRIEDPNGAGDVAGRGGSPLEVPAGFHREITGRVFHVQGETQLPAPAAA